MPFFARMKITAVKLPMRLLATPEPLMYIGAKTIDKAAEHAAALGMTHALILCSPSIVRLGLLSPLLAQMDARALAYTVCSDVHPDPTFEAVGAALMLCCNHECDGVIAFGGGSVLDSAKVVAAAASNGCAPRALQGLFKVKHARLPLMIIPTTAGTGSEATMAAVITDTKRRRKVQVLDGKLVPDVAILDATLTVSLPPRVTAETAMDALTHALEAYLSTYATPQSTQFARLAVQRIAQNVLVVYQNPTDLAAREAMLVAAYYAGRAINRAYIGYVHAFAHSIGARYGVAHGLANAVLLPHVLAHYLPLCAVQLAELSDLLGLAPEATTSKKAAAFIDYLRALNNSLGIPARIDAFPREDIPAVCSAAFAECHGTYPVPRYFPREEAETLLSTVCRAKA